MPGKNGSSATPTWTDEIAARAQRERERLIVARTKVRTELDRVDAEIRRCDRIQRAIEEPKAKGQKKKKAAGKASFGPERLRETVEAIRRFGPEETWTVLELHEANWPDGVSAHTYSVVKALREREFVARIGKDPETNRDRYQVLDADAAERILAEAVV